MKFSGRGILLDIEGTTSSVSFVYDVMFPFVYRELDHYLDSNWDSPALNEVCDLIAKDAGCPSLATWHNEINDVTSQQLVHKEVIRLMDGDIKATGLKKLQGLIWRSGFESGELQAHVYDDVPQAIQTWKNLGCDVRIYSSGSVEAQKLFFQYTIFGNMRHLYHGYYDTATGSKKEAESYRTISKDFSLLPSEILFLSDMPSELDAARDAGLQTGLCKRPGKGEVPPDHGHPEIMSFDQVEVESTGSFLTV